MLIKRKLSKNERLEFSFDDADGFINVRDCITRKTIKLTAQEIEDLCDYKMIITGERTE